MARVNRGVPSANGELLFCELPDGMRGALPAWMTNAAACAVMTVGQPVVTITALQELRCCSMLLWLANQTSPVHQCPQRRAAMRTKPRAIHEVPTRSIRQKRSGWPRKKRCARPAPAMAETARTRPGR
jgi:hypothetical protein